MNMVAITLIKQIMKKYVHANFIPTSTSIISALITTRTMGMFAFVAQDQIFRLIALYIRRIMVVFLGRNAKPVDILG